MMKNLWKKQVPALLLALVMLVSLMPAAEAKETNISYTVKAGSSVAFDAADFDKLLGDEASLIYVEFSDPRRVDACGSIASKQYRASKGRAYDVTLGADDLKPGARFVYDEAYLENGDYLLDGTFYEADRYSDGDTVTMEFKAVGENLLSSGSTKVYGTLTIQIGRASSGGGSSGGSSSSSRTIRYNARAGRTIDLDRYDFETVFSDEYPRGTFDYVEFTAFARLDDYGYLEAEDQSGKRVEIDEAYLDGTYFHYDYKDIGYKSDCDLNTLQFTSYTDAKGTLEMDFKLVGQNTKETVNGTLKIEIGGSGSDHSNLPEIQMAVLAGEGVSLDRAKFREMFRADKDTTGDLNYMTFTKVSGLDSYGFFEADALQSNDTFRSTRMEEADLDQVWFHYYASDVSHTHDCDLDTLVFRARDGVEGKLTLEFELVGERKGESVAGRLVLTIRDRDSSKPSARDADILYTVKPNQEVMFDGRDFSDFYQKHHRGDMAYVSFTKVEGLSSAEGSFYNCYEVKGEKKFSASDMEGYYFYYRDETEGDYDLDDLSFVAGRHFEGPILLTFRVYGSSSRWEEGTVAILMEKEEELPDFGEAADIRYFAASGDMVNIRAHDIAHFYEKKNPGSTLQYVRLGAAPIGGQLIYNFYGTSPYGDRQMAITDSNCRDQVYAYHPGSSREFDLNELLFVPFGYNFCAKIPFTAYGSGNRASSGNIFISVTQSAVAESYKAVLKGTSVAFPAPMVYQQVQKAAGKTLAGIRFLALPAAEQGTLVVKNNSYTIPVTLKDNFAYNYGTKRMNQVTFVPNKNYTGNVELPYAAYDASGHVYAAGVVSIGVLNKNHSFKDVSASSTWCYKYIVELADEGIISGYKDGTFKEKNTLTWGAALKLICLANNVGRSGDTFDTFLSLARSKGWVSGKVDLTRGITRLEFCRVAAKAMGLDSGAGLRSPFSDTQDPAVLALNAAGIIGGYADGTFQPGRQLTRGHISAIIWRMNQDRK